MFRHHRDVSSHLNRQHDFKDDYYKIQRLINDKVHLSLKFEQLKSPEIHSTLMKPITDEILRISELSSSPLAAYLQHDTQPEIIGSSSLAVTERRDSRLGRSTYTTLDAVSRETIEGPRQKVSNNVIFILLLLRYEYLIQSENNLVCFDLLITKATVCELLSIRMLREYKSLNRVNMLFIKPLYEVDQQYNFNTLELSVLCNAKKFLSQPIIVRILERFYNGELINNESSHMTGSGMSYTDDEKGLLEADCVTDYQFGRISYKQIIKRANTVPKYQSIVINFKLIMLSIFYFSLIFGNPMGIGTLFWIIGLSFNIELITKLYNIEWQFVRTIIWNYIDFCLIFLIDLSFALKIANTPYFSDVFSLIGIILFPRILSIFNNYKFFNLIVLSFNKMIWNLVGLIFFFFTLISGFYFSFLTLSINQAKGEILFDMVKIFFGFTPSVWNNWENYNLLGKFTLMGYLFLIQFIVGTILAICLSGVFAKVRDSNQEEFNYFKTTNLILYFKMARLNNSNNWTNSFLHIFKIPIIIILFGYELIKSKSFHKQISSELKNFTFLKQDEDNIQGTGHEVDGESNIMGRSTKRRLSRRYNKYQSLSTLNGGNIRTASTDSFFINELLNKRYGGKIEKVRTNTSERVISRKFLQQPFAVPRQPQPQAQHQQPLQNIQTSRQQSPPSIISSPPHSGSHNNNNNFGTVTDNILTRLNNLENNIAKRTLMSTSVDDNKSVMMYNINEIENNDSNEEISINSQEMDSPEDEFESSKDNTMEDIDQYDSDETF
ncbi:hypothetical protein MG5_02421 [Candida albicans P57072]|nr:hypothetical protein MG5_02421 [Candida albicans P57072]